MMKLIKHIRIYAHIILESMGTKVYCYVLWIGPIGDPKSLDVLKKHMILRSLVVISLSS